MVPMTFDQSYAVVVSCLRLDTVLLLFRQPFALQEGRILERFPDESRALQAAYNFVHLYSRSVVWGYKISDGHFVHPNDDNIPLCDVLQIYPTLKVYLRPINSFMA